MSVVRDCPAGSLRVMSANLWQAADPQALVDQVEELAVDVLAVQELVEAQAEALSRVLPFGSLEPADDYTGMGIALRRSGEYERIAMPCRDARLARISVDGNGAAPAQIEVVNVHVIGPHVHPAPRSLWMRREQWRRLSSYFESRPSVPRVVVGDFNSTAQWPFYRRMAARMRDAAVEVARRRGESPRPTWGPWYGSARLIRIDHAFVDGLEVVDFQTVSVRGADHSGIVVDLAVTHR